MKQEIQKKLQEIVKELTKEHTEVLVTLPKDINNGDFTSNIAFHLSKTLKKSPLAVAEEIVKKFGKLSGIEYIEPASPGFINFYLSRKALSENLQKVLDDPEKVAGINQTQKDKKFLVEFAHPNTHKEMHIGHMRTLITGESISRLLEAVGGEVFRANYQGDIGPHVAKAMVGIQKMMHEEAQEKGKTFEEVWDGKNELSNKDKAHFLGEGYIEGNKVYDSGKMKNEIDVMNSFLYLKLEGREDESPLNDAEKIRVWNLYQQTKKWSLDYYDEFYTRFYTKFNHLFLESQMVTDGKRIVKEYVGKVFQQDTDKSIYFPGEKYGLHTRVFMTQAGNPTYEGKEMGNAYAEWEAFHFDKKIHVVANEQAGYFQVVFKALELIDPKKFKDKQLHLSMGMVQLVGRKMSSRTGDVLTVDWLIDQVKGAAENLFKEGKVAGEEKEKALEEVTIGAVKYSVLKGGTGQNVTFDIEKSVSLDGNSGPYIQYAYTRTQSVLEKAESIKLKPQLSQNYTILEDEKKLMQKLTQFSSAIEDAARSCAPHIVCEYLFELSQLFNNFYQKYRILNAEKQEEKEFRLALTKATGIVLKNGLFLLGISAPQKM